MYRESYFDLKFQSLGATNVCLCYALGKVWQIWHFAMSLSILLPLSQNLTPSLCTTLYVHTSQRWQTFSLFALSESVYTEKYLTLYYSLLIYPKRILLWSVTDGLTDWLTEKILHPLLPNSFFSIERMGPYPEAQLCWAGWTVGWMASLMSFLLFFVTHFVFVMLLLANMMLNWNHLLLH